VYYSQYNYFIGPRLGTEAGVITDGVFSKIGVVFRIPVAAELDMWKVVRCSV